MWWYWIVGILFFFIIIEELIYYLENRIVFGKRKPRLIPWVKNLFNKEPNTRPAHEQGQRRSRKI